MMRDYRRLRDAGELGRIESALFVLADTPLGVTTAARERFFGTATPIAEKVVRQFLLAQIAGMPLKMKMISSLGSSAQALMHPLPPAWCDALSRNGFKLSKCACTLMWMAYLVGMFAYAWLAIAKSLAVSLRRDDAPYEGSAYFDGLSASQLPRDQKPSYDIFSWYASWRGRHPEVSCLSHSISEGEPKEALGLPLVCVSQPQPLPQGSRQRITLLRDFTKLACIALLDFLRGRWWHMLLLREVERAALINQAPRERLPKEYLMSNSGWLYRPLWTYAAEAAGSRVTFYFYSTNAAVFKTASGYPRQTNHWELCTWSRYLVWEDGQRDFLRRLGIDAPIDIVGPIWFSDADAILPSFKPPAIAVFDVQPMRESIYRSLALGFEYYTARAAIGFVEGIGEATNGLQLKILFKRKRNVGRNIHPLYAGTLARLTDAGLLISVEPGLAAQHMIEACACVVSMPFTSTALIARAMGKPSCYFDPTGLVQPDDRSAYGIEVFNTPEALRDWIASKVMV